MDLTAEMEKYLRLLQCMRFQRPPREALAYAAGGEIFVPEMHLAFNAAPYVIIGKYVRELDKAAGRILEIGSGTGYDISYLKRHFIQKATVTGIDRIPELARYAAENYSRPGLKFMSADACLLPFGEESFEMVIAVFSIVHTMNRDQARDCLAEISRVLSPKGTLIFTTSNRELSQDLYHENPGDQPRLFFCHLLRREYRLSELKSFLLSLGAGEEKLFDSISIDSLTNTALRPAWAETLEALRTRRFTDSGRETLLPSLARRILPQSFKARYFFRKIQKACRRRNISLQDIARGARRYPEGEGVQADHFLVVARKAG